MGDGDVGGQCLHLTKGVFAEVFDALTAAVNAPDAGEGDGSARAGDVGDGDVGGQCDVGEQGHQKECFLVAARGHGGLGDVLHVLECSCDAMFGSERSIADAVADKLKPEVKHQWSRG